MCHLVAEEAAVAEAEAAVAEAEAAVEAVKRNQKQLIICSKCECVNYDQISKKYHQKQEKNQKKTKKPKKPNKQIFVC